MAIIKVITGYGKGTTYPVDITHIAQFPRNSRGHCAMCDGDPCGEHSPPEALILQVIADARVNGYTVETCPLCEGRPS